MSSPLAPGFAIILCYHKVGSESEEGRKLNISPERLESHVQFFSRRRPIRLAHELAGSWPQGLACFTFDDAYASTMVNAPAILERHGARGSFYAVTGQVGATSDWDGALARPLANWESLRQAESSGHEIGNHTASHIRLGHVSAREQTSEVLDADRILRREGLSPRSFCYPYGWLNPDAVSAVREAGYQVGLALGKRVATTNEDPLALSRIVVAFSDSLPMLLYRIYIRPTLRWKSKP